MSRTGGGGVSEVAPETPCPDCGLDPNDDTLHQWRCRRIFPRGHPLARLQFGPPYEPWTRAHWVELQEARAFNRVGMPTLDPAEPSPVLLNPAESERESGC